MKCIGISLVYLSLVALLGLDKQGFVEFWFWGVGFVGGGGFGGGESIDKKFA